MSDSLRHSTASTRKVHIKLRYEIAGVDGELRGGEASKCRHRQRSAVEEMRTSPPLLSDVRTCQNDAADRCFTFPVPISDNRCHVDYHYVLVGPRMD